MIHNGRIHEHAAVGENPVEISGQGAQIPEGIFSLILDNPVLNLFGKGIPIGFVEGELPALGVLWENHADGFHIVHGLIDVESPGAGVFQGKRECSRGDDKHSCSNIIPPRP